MCARVTDAGWPGCFEAGALGASVVGLGKEGVALGAMRNVDAGASTFFSVGLAVLAVCGIGSAHCQQSS